MSATSGGRGQSREAKKNSKTDLDYMINNKRTTCLSNLEWTESDDKNSSDSQIGLGLRPRLVSVWLFSEFISFSHYFEIEQHVLTVWKIKYFNMKDIK